MDRDWNVIREILLKLEQSETANSNLNAKDLNDYEEQNVAYNMRLLDDDKCIIAMIIDTHDGSGKIGSATAERMTNKGHDLLDTIRNDNIWRKIKEHFYRAGINMTIDLVITTGRHIIESIIIPKIN